jgi:hypothetical protein
MSAFTRILASFDFRLLQQYRHRTDLAQASLHVCYWGYSGRNLLAASISPFDPKRTFAYPIAVANVLRSAIRRIAVPLTHMSFGEVLWT